MNLGLLINFGPVKSCQSCLPAYLSGGSNKKIETHEIMGVPLSPQETFSKNKKAENLGIVVNKLIN